MPPYKYTSPSREELKAIADAILMRFPDRRIGEAIDIEGIVEDFGIRIIYRQMKRVNGKYVDGFVPCDPRYMVINEIRTRSLERLRNTIGHELAHLILEFDLLSKGTMPDGARSHELEPSVLKAIESDAKKLAAEILMPERKYKVIFESHKLPLTRAGLDDFTATKGAIKETASKLIVSNTSSSYRARDLGYLSERVRKRMFPFFM